MRENNSHGLGTTAIELDHVIEGDQIGSRNYRFVKVGESVPIKSPATDDSQYDSETPPSRPLAVSERFRLLFIAHSNGFYVARTKEVMTLAEDIKEKGSGLSIDELSILNLSIGRVSILALSSGDSLLAASVANQLYFFFISALLHKEQEPSFSVCIDDLSCIKDMKWARSRKTEKNYVILSSNGKLYQGFAQGSPKNVMDNVDAVEWSPKGAFVAVARKNLLSIMSSQFTEKLSFLLSSTSVIVDSIGWIRADSIVLGCFDVGDDSEQASYFVQVITTQRPEITDASSKPVVLSFSDVFLDYQCNIVPRASGPNLFLSYLDHHELAFTANRKNLSQHVVLLGWSLDDKKNEAVTIELLNDAWSAHIEPQGNGDDNLILGLCVDKVSQNDQIKFSLGEEETEVSPCCVLLCITIDGKLSLFHFFSAAGASGSMEAFADSDGEDACSVVHPERGLSEISTEVRDQNVQHVSCHLESDEIQVDDVDRENNKPSASRESKQSSVGNEEQKPPVHFQTIKVGIEETNSVSKLNQDGGKRQSVSAEYSGPEIEDWPSKTPQLEGFGIKSSDFCKTETQAFFEAKPLANSLSEKVSTDLSGQSINKNLQASSSLEFREKNVPTDLRIASPSWSFEKMTPPRTSDENSSSTSIIHKKSSGIPGRNTLNSAGGLFRSPPNSKETTVPSVGVNFSGQRPTTVMGDIGSLPAFGKSQVLLQENIASRKSSMPQICEEDLSTSSQLQWPNYEQKLSKQIYNVEVMAKKMDRLLEAIGGEGGFREASTTSQEDSVVALEEGLWTISERCRMLEGLLEERLREIQLLRDKTVQVLARKIYLEGIFQQASDNWYWGFFNCQKLSSELELKRQHIVELDQVLTTRLVELERHFNTLEFNKFGKSRLVQTNARAVQSSNGKSRQQSLYSLRNTMGAQLAAAEKLSDCLWKQMAALSMELPAKQQNVKRELFETLGLTYDVASYDSPADQKATETPTKQLLTMPCSATAKELSWRSQYTPLKGSEPETVRRRRDSLDQKWSSSEAPKTTVKRILLREELESNSSSSRSLGKVENQPLKPRPRKESAAAHSIVSDTPATSAFQSKSQTVYETQVKQSVGHSLTPSQAAGGLADPAMQVLTNGSPAVWQQSTSTASASRNGARESHNLSGNSRSSLFKTSESLLGSDSRYIQQSEIALFDAQSTSERFPAISVTTSKNDFEIPKNDVAIKDLEHTVITTKSSVTNSNSNYKASVSPAAPVGSSPNFSGKIIDAETAFGKIHPGGTKSFPAIQSSANLTTQVNSSSTTSSSLSKAGAAMSSGKFSSSEAKIDMHQKVSQSHLIFSSPLTTESTLSSSIPKPDGGSSTTPLLRNESTEGLEPGSQPLVSVFGSKGDGDATKETMFSNSSSATGEIFKTPDSVTQLRLTDGTSILNLEPTVPSLPDTEYPGSLKSENQLNRGGVSNSASEMPPNTKIEQPWPSTTNSSAVMFSGILNGGKNGSSAVTNEDEMEEEAPEGSLTTEVALGNLGGFGIGSTPNPTVVKPNPFGVEMPNKAAISLSSPFTVPTPSGELFRPASFNFQSPLSSQPSQPANIGAFSSGFGGGGTSRGPTASGFGQPAQFGSGQQALGSVLGAFGQSRQLGASPPSSIAPQSGFGSGLNGMSTAGFGGGFSSVAPAGGGFASLAAGGGFAAAAMAGAGGGFAAVATAGGGFAAAATAAAGFASSGFGAFNNQAAGGFSTFASNSGAGRPPSELFTQMRK